MSYNKKFYVPTNIIPQSCNSSNWNVYVTETTRNSYVEKQAKIIKWCREHICDSRTPAWKLVEPVEVYLGPGDVPVIIFAGLLLFDEMDQTAFKLSFGNSCTKIHA